MKKTNTINRKSVRLFHQLHGQIKLYEICNTDYDARSNYIDFVDNLKNSMR